ncbi:MAG: DUF1778 domain-containing protein [Rhizobiaceae bacterium]
MATSYRLAAQHHLVQTIAKLYIPRHTKEMVMPEAKPTGQNPQKTIKSAASVVLRPPKTSKDSAKRAIMKSMRIDTQTCNVIERAAAITGDSFTHFVIQAALAKAHNALIDEAFFPISQEAYDQLGDMLQNPPELSERMKADIQKRRAERAAHSKAGRAA